MNLLPLKNGPVSLANLINEMKVTDKTVGTVWSPAGAGGQKKADGLVNR